MSTLTAPLAADAFNTLYQTHHRWLRHWLQHKLGSSCDADDLAQDTFVRVLLGGSAQDIREPKSFLCTVARRVMVDFFRRNALERAWLEMLEQLPEAQVPSPELQHELLETLQEIDAMLDGLGAKVRQAFLLSQLEGLTYAQIAGQLNVSVSSVKKYMARATEHCLLFRLGLG
ncbi:sigma-70 family RNA polymerase sigma factor [Erwinia persicina]|uniref:ferric citrate uptake sigma factor FecI n=1 Tax=Erwinia persicina TaxID=55211 RepID=UPI0016549C27|nr:ferric citrate uptake sigma factor FecI [Erwinia persicina]MBC3945182.1 sigma-70 family RNA polymerase sigma factor [Erwinia persicina]MCQ4103436.1 sigma-70 family RNA polymerase sigma factor [Erwinia persicina]UTX13604.1 sigma-70 family RNA polymerase sigma factor [Erwinia persicina]